MDEITARLDEFIRERCEVGDDPEYSLDVNLFDAGFLDSMGAVETITFAEQTFGVEITQKDITLYPVPVWQQDSLMEKKPAPMKIKKPHTQTKGKGK